MLIAQSKTSVMHFCIARYQTNWYFTDAMCEFVEELWSEPLSMELWVAGYKTVQINPYKTSHRPFSETVFEQESRPSISTTEGFVCKFTYTGSSCLGAKDEEERFVSKKTCFSLSSEF